MYKTKLSSSLSAAILVVLLMFTVVAQAKRPAPGGDTPGSTTLEVPYTFVGYADDEASCFNAADWCAQQTLDAFTDTALAANGDGTANATAAAIAELACAASASAYANFGLYFEGGGLLSLTRNGLNGSMHHIEFAAGLTTLSGTYVSTSAAAQTYASGQALVIAGAQSLSDVCATWVYDDDPIFEVCSWAQANGLGNGQVDSYAASYGSGWSEAGSYAGANLGTWTEVFAANIEKFDAVVTAGGGTFTYAQGSSYVASLAEAYAHAYAQAFTEACVSLDIIVNDIGYAELCSQGSSAAEAEAEAYATSWTEAYASAIVETYVATEMPAHYENTASNVDYISFGPGTTAYGAANLEVSCQVPAQP